MTLYYSKTTNGFYDDVFIYANMPTDAVVITPETRQALLIAQSSGKAIQSDANGNPTAVDITTLPQTPAQEAALAISAGAIIVSDSDPAINSVYAVTSVQINKLMGVILSIVVSGVFPNGLTNMLWPDIYGNMMVFTSTNLFKAFAVALSHYVTAVNLYGDSNGTVGSIPSNTLRID